MHDICGLIRAATVSGQNPLESVIEQTFHRVDLPGPRIPCDVTECSQAAAIIRPCEMVTGEEIFVPIQKDNMAAGVAGHRYRHEIVIDGDGVVAFKELIHR